MKSLVNLLTKKKLKLSVAESCTGGMLASSITSISGASKIFNLGLVTYSNQAKIKILRVNKNINTLFVTMFGLGKIPKIPGTFGSLATVILLYIFFHILNLSPIIIFLFLIIIFFFSFISVTIYIRDNTNKDPKEVVIDEFIGQSIPIYMYEISHGTEKAIIFYGACFILFRFFDIVKPFPVNFFDNKFKNSFGVIMDDICAGFYVVLSLICFMVLSSYFV